MGAKIVFFSEVCKGEGQFCAKYMGCGLGKPATRTLCGWGRERGRAGTGAGGDKQGRGERAISEAGERAWQARGEDALRVGTKEGGREQGESEGGLFFFLGGGRRDKKERGL